MQKEDIQPHYAGFVNILGNPNVGKSTLMNLLVGEELSIITAKAQTTRHRIRGIVNGENFQIVYSDLPGILLPAYQLQNKMMDFVGEAMRDADIFLYVVECGETKYNDGIIRLLQQTTNPVLLVINKIDGKSEENIAHSVQHWGALLPQADICTISALHGTNVEQLQQKIVSKLPVSPPYFPKDELTDRPMRFFVSELIREQILLLYKKEVPYSVEVVVDYFKEEENVTRIGAILYVERDSQKAIILGKQGKAIKELGIKSRQEIEKFLEQHIFLDLSVKVLKNWRRNENYVKGFGYF